MVKEKIFKGFLVLNWKTGQTKIIKNSRYDLNPWDIRVPYNIKITLPEIKDTPLNIDVKLPIVDTSNIKM